MDDADLQRGVAHLEAADPALARVIGMVGPPAIRRDGPEPFRALVRAIVYQQLSGKAAGTIHGRFLALFEAEDGSRFPEPHEVLALDDETLRGVGLSRQKTASIRDLAAYVADGRIDSARITELSDDEVIAELTRVRGIGRWTAEMYLIFNLGRPDVLPVNDLGINRAIMNIHGLGALPSAEQVRAIGAAWRPWASIACWYLWRSTDVVLPGDSTR
jgi:DNA-3-methyladenine glycosylase II